MNVHQPPGAQGLRGTGLRRLLAEPTRFLFFTGKGGVGKTSLSSAAAIALADAGKKVLLVSTDCASNLDEMLGAPLSNQPVAVPGVSGLSLLNIDPTAAAEGYRQRVLKQLAPETPDAEREALREALSGACTTEIAAFDELVALLAGDTARYDHVVFDTAPTGHTLRLLRLPKAWAGFLEHSEHGASCLGPHTALKNQESRFRQAMQTLASAPLCTVVLVTLPERAAIAEAARTARELVELGLTHQHLAINGEFRASVSDDAIAMAIEAQGQQAIAELPPELARLPRDVLPLQPFDTVGLPALRALIDETAPMPEPKAVPEQVTVPAARLAELVDALSEQGHGLVMVMGKGGVGKTTLAAAIALGLAKRGHKVHLSTTDPAAHLEATLAGERGTLEVSRIDPAVERQRYVDKVMATRGRELDAEGKALLLEDLRSPCTEEIAVFHAFSHVINGARDSFVVLDTAPTGHSLLLLDATGAYHRQSLRHLPAAVNPLRVTTALMRLQDPAFTRVIVVTLAETTPVSQAAALQGDLRRAGIEPFAWVVNRSLIAAGARDPVLAARVAGERRQIARIAGGLAQRTYLVPWRPTAPVGAAALEALIE